MIALKNRLKSFAFWILRFIQLQLFLTIVSLPILVAWGLPLSVLSPLGNLIFGPVLTLFLTLCSAIFFCELLGIPTTWLIIVLEKVTDWWLVIMHSDSPRWLIGFIKPSPFFMIIIPLAAFWIVLRNNSWHRYVTTGLLAFLFVAIVIYLKGISSPLQPVMALPCNKGAVTLVSTPTSTLLIDPGFMGQRVSAISWAQYTLMPSIITLTGSTTIDHLVIMQPTSMALEAVERLCTKMNIKNIYLVYWQGKATPSYMRNFFALKKTATDNSIAFHRIGKDTLSITLGAPTNRCEISPLAFMIKNGAFSYPAVRAQLFIDNQEITIYSAKYANKIKSTSREKTQLNPIT